MLKLFRIYCLLLLPLAFISQTGTQPIAKLGKKVKIHPNIIGRYERGETIPSLDISFKLADVLEVSLDFLTGFRSTEWALCNVDRGGVLSVGQ